MADYYPDFNPKDFYCDTVAVKNASVVAQIVGKKGARIKALIAKFNTSIRTPKLDGEPVFVIKGKRPDVYNAKQEIMSVAAHFMRIDSAKREKFNAAMNDQEYTSTQLIVPLRYIGLVIGKRGRVVRNLQTIHKVYIDTPLFGVRPFFRIFGTKVALTSAINAVYQLLVSKTGILFDYSESELEGGEMQVRLSFQE